MSFTADLTFPPLFKGEAVGASFDPFAKAVSRAGTGADPGLIVYARDEASARMAVILAPDAPLDEAIGVIFAVSLGLSDSLGALAPPEVAVHFTWPDRYKVNGALCGRMRVASASDTPSQIPDWLVVGLDVPIRPNPNVEPGQIPDQTALIEEGCADVSAPALIESWSRHMLYWINKYMDEGFAPIHKNWCGKCEDIGSQLDGGTFLGLDEKGGMLLRVKDKTHAVPLTSILEAG